MPAKSCEGYHATKPTGEVTKGGQYTQEQIAQALTKLEVRDYQDQGKWFRLMCAVHHASDGDARTEFIEWCIGDPEYANDGEAVGRRWDSLHTKRQDGTITYKTLNKILADAGAADAQAAPDASSDFKGDPIEDDDDGDEFAQPNGLEYSLYSDIAETEIHWLWIGRFAIGKVGLLAGMPGDGKSLITCDIAARVTRGDVWPDGSGRAPKGAVIILSSEDDESDRLSRALPPRARI